MKSEPTSLSCSGDFSIANFKLDLTSHVRIDADEVSVESDEKEIRLTIGQHGVRSKTCYHIDKKIVAALLSEVKKLNV